MIIQFSRNFEKQLIKQDQKVRIAFNKRLSIYVVDPNNPALRNHALKGKYKEFRSINITGDVRALYQEKEGDITLFALIGTHSQLY